MSSSSSESGDFSFQYVDGADSVLSCDSWNNLFDGAGSGAGQNINLADQFGLLGIAGTDESSLPVDMGGPPSGVAARTEESTKVSPQQSGEFQGIATKNDAVAGSSSCMDDLGARQDQSDSLVCYSSDSCRYDGDKNPMASSCLARDDSAALPAIDGKKATEHDTTAACSTPVSSPMSAPIARAWGGGTCPGDSALVETFSVPEQLLFRGTFEQAMAAARDEKKLLLVSIQDYEGANAFGSFAVNRDIFRNEQFENLASARYVFIQLSLNIREALDYANYFQVEHFPHLGIVYPGHRNLVWGIDGWSSEQPWVPGKIMEALVDWGFTRFTDEHHELMQVDEDVTTEENFPVDPVSDINQEYMLQEAAMADIDLDDPEEVENFFYLQSAMLWS
mmetsp:Transcript_58158/g.87650  ORF Transcript_58158/g.87650 Transcript_58158/m.87650 type:complete len:392 (+) Transcript_58158:47-1222(+)